MNQGITKHIWKTYAGLLYIKHKFLSKQDTGAVVQRWYQIEILYHGSLKYMVFFQYTMVLHDYLHRYLHGTLRYIFLRLHVL